MDQHGSATLDASPFTGGADAARRPWEAHYPPGLSWQVPVMAGTLPELLDRSAATCGGKPALEYRDRQISYAELAAMVDRMAAGFLAAGYGPGKTIALFLPNTPWHTVCFFAALKAGARLAHLSPLDAQRELVFKIADSSADLVVTTDLGGLAQGAAKLVTAGAAPSVLVGEDPACFFEYAYT